MNILIQTIIFGIVMTLIDVPWISLVMSRLYKNVFKIKINYIGAIIAYLCMIVTYPFIISKFDTLKEKLEVALVIGLITFGTYGFTLAAIYDKYPLTTALAETLWGMTLFTLTTFISDFIIKKIN